MAEKKEVTSEAKSEDNVFNLVTPQTSKLYFDNGTNKLELELVQFLKYIIEDNKKPIYGFTNQSFSKTIKGKRIVSGVIGVKKTTRDVIGKLIKEKTSRTTDGLTEYSMLKASTVIDLITTNEEFLSSDLKTVNDFFYNYQEYLNKRINLTLESEDEDSFLDIENAYNGLSPISIKLYKEGQFDKKPILSFDNITFVSKEGTIAIQENTVLEIYSFIANCG